MFLLKVIGEKYGLIIYIKKIEYEFQKIENALTKLNNFMLLFNNKSSCMISL